ncbi:MAG: hypothetical protein ACKVXR_14570 [Planctomycetota bacterium]
MRNKLYRRGARSRAGMSLVEATIAAAITAVILGAIGRAALSGQSSATQTMVATELETQARGVVDRIAEELVAARTTGLNPSPTGTFGSSTLTYQKCTGYAGGVATFGTNQRIRWVLEPTEIDNGADDDRDGLIDEGMVEFTRDLGAGTQRIVRWARGVREYLARETPNVADDNANGLIDERGLSFSLTGRVLTIRLTLQGIAEKGEGASGRILTRTVETSVRLRN